jgi:glutaredoxin
MIQPQIMLELLILLANLTPSPPSILSAIEQPHLRSIALYYSPRCPHSKRVISYIQKKHLLISLRDVTTDPEAKEQLKRIGGYSIVPCLIVNETPIYNDDDIISWLTYHDDQLPHSSQLSHGS